MNDAFTAAHYQPTMTSISTIFLHYLYSLSTKQLAHIVLSYVVTVCIGLFTLGISITYIYIQDKKEKYEENKDPMILYGIKETAVTIQHQFLNKDDEEFLRHVRALSTISMTEMECLEVLDNLSAFLKLHKHPNTRDVKTVHKAIQYGYISSALQWLHVAKAFWILHPWDEMIQYIVLEHYNEPEPKATFHSVAEVSIAPSLVPA